MDFEQKEVFQVSLKFVKFHPFGQKKITLISRKVGDEKNLHLSGHKFIFSNQFSGDILFSSAVILIFLILVFLFVWCFLKLKMYILIYIRLYGRVSDKKNIHPADFRKQGNFFWSKIEENRKLRHIFVKC